MTWLKRTLLIVLAVVLFLLAVVALSIPIDRALGRGRLETLTNTTLPHPEGFPLRAYVARPQEAGVLPVVIMIHEFWGINESLVSKAELLAQEGYVVIAPDTFRGRTTRWLPSAIFQTIRTPEARIIEDIDAAYRWAQAQADIDPTRIGIVGFCYGGRASLRYSLFNPEIAATVIFYGNPVTDPERLRVLQAPVLGIFGEADSSIPLENVRAFQTALQSLGHPHRISIYPGQGHAFVQNAAGILTGGAQGQAWAEMVGFLGETLNP